MDEVVRKCNIPYYSRSGRSKCRGLRVESLVVIILNNERDLGSSTVQQLLLIDSDFAFGQGVNSSHHFLCLKTYVYFKCNIFDISVDKY